MENEQRNLMNLLFQAKVLLEAVVVAEKLTENTLSLIM